MQQGEAVSFGKFFVRRERVTQLAQRTYDENALHRAPFGALSTTKPKEMPRG